MQGRKWRSTTRKNCVWRVTLRNDRIGLAPILEMAGAARYFGRTFQYLNCYLIAASVIPLKYGDRNVDREEIIESMSTSKERLLDRTGNPKTARDCSEDEIPKRC